MSKKIKCFGILLIVAIMLISTTVFAANEDVTLEKVKDDIYQIKNGDFLTKIDKYFDCFYPTQANLLDYLNKNFVVILDDISKINQRQKNINQDNSELIKALMDKEKIVPEAIENMLGEVELKDKFEEHQLIYLASITKE